MVRGLVVTITMMLTVTVALQCFKLYMFCCRFRRDSHSRGVPARRANTAAALLMTTFPFPCCESVEYRYLICISTVWHYQSQNALGGRERLLQLLRISPSPSWSLVCPAVHLFLHTSAPSRTSPH